MKHRSFLFWAALLAFCASLAAQETAPEKPANAEAPLLRGALVRATESGSTADAGAIPEKMAERLRKAFDYPNFFLIGEHSQPIGKEYHSWVVPSSELFLRVDYKGEEESGRNLHLQLWQKGNVVVKTDVILRPNSPIFFAGPAHGDDQLVFVVELQQ